MPLVCQPEAPHPIGLSDSIAVYHRVQYCWTQRYSRARRGSLRPCWSCCRGIGLLGVCFPAAIRPRTRLRALPPRCRWTHAWVPPHGAAGQTLAAKGVSLLSLLSLSGTCAQECARARVCVCVCVYVCVCVWRGAGVFWGNGECLSFHDIYGGCTI